MITPVAQWKPSNLIRNLTTGKLYMVIHVVKGYATLISPLDTQELPPTITLFPRDYDKYCKDGDAVLDHGKWKHDRIIL